MDQQPLDNPRPNIILIVIDSLRYDHVGRHGDRPSLTPNLDRLADEGLVFDQAITQGPSTRVAMSALMSSTYASMYGGQLQLSKNRPVVQVLLGQSGYTSAAITANLYLSRRFGWSRGFDYYDDCRPVDVYHRNLWLRAANQVTKRTGSSLGWPRSLSASLVFKNAGLFMKRATRPFFMWVHLMDTHWPYSIQDFTWNKQRKQKRQSESLIQARLIGDPPEITPSEHSQLVTDYKQAVRYTDEQLGLFRDRLERAGLLEDSWIFVTADHGEEFNEHGHYFHQVALFEELVHVPLIVRPPTRYTLPHKKRVEAQVRLIDLVPTFLDIAQASAIKDGLCGASLLPLMQAGVEGNGRPAILESPGNTLLALRADGWKLIWNTDTGEKFLFDLAADPIELVNRIMEEPVKAAEMQTVLEAHLNMVKATTFEGVEKQPALALEPDLLEQLRNLGYVE